MIMNYMKLIIPLHFISWKKKTPSDAVTPQRQSQFTPKMKANAVPRLLSSLVWIDQYNERNGMTSFVDFMLMAHKHMPPKWAASGRSLMSNISNNGARGSKGRQKTHLASTCLMIPLQKACLTHKRQADPNQTIINLVMTYPTKSRVPLGRPSSCSRSSTKSLAARSSVILKHIICSL